MLGLVEVYERDGVKQLDFPGMRERQSVLNNKIN